MTGPDRWPAGQSNDSEPVCFDVTLMLCQMRLAQPEWVCVRDSCRNENKCVQQLTQKVIDAYCGSKINKCILYDLGRLRNIARPKCFNTIAMWFYSSSINKKLKLSDLHFRHNIDCFCSISLMKIFQSHSRTVLCIWATQRCFVTEWIHVFERIKWVNDSVTHS